MLIQNLISQSIVVKYRPPRMYEIKIKNKKQKLAGNQLRHSLFSRSSSMPGSCSILFLGLISPGFLMAGSPFMNFPAHISSLQRPFLTTVSKIAPPSFCPFVLLSFPSEHFLTTQRHRMSICLFFVIYVPQYRHNQTFYKEPDSILKFSHHMVSVVTTQLCHCNT